MNATTKLFSKLKSAGSIGAIVGIVALAIVVIVGLAMLGGLIFVWGLNLMGFEVAYTFKTIIGAAVVILCLRPSGFGGSKEK